MHFESSGQGQGYGGQNPPPISQNILIIFTKTLTKRRSGAYLQCFHTLKTLSSSNFWRQNSLRWAFLATPLVLAVTFLTSWDVKLSHKGPNHVYQYTTISMIAMIWWYWLHNSSQKGIFTMGQPQQHGIKSWSICYITYSLTYLYWKKSAFKITKIHAQQGGGTYWVLWELYYLLYRTIMAT